MLRIKRILLPAIFFALLSHPFLGSSLFADRITLTNGEILRGEVLNIGTKSYKFKTLDGTVHNVPKNRIEGIIFSGGLAEKGYGAYFIRSSLTLNQADYNEELAFENDITGNISASNMGLLGLALDLGYMLIDHVLALHGGLEYKHALSPKELSCSYLSLRTGFSYYFALPWLSNLYISPYVSYLLHSSVQSTLESVGEIEASLDRPELSYGLSLGKEWYGSGRLVYGAGFSLGKDFFTLFYPNAHIKESSVGINYAGIFLSISYD